MNTLLALSLAITNGVAVVRCVTPGAGSFSVQCSADMRDWRVVESGYVAESAHVAATVPVDNCGFFRVEWVEKARLNSAAGAPRP